MQVTVDQQKVFAMLDVLVGRWKEKRYPYNRPDAVIPQTILPTDLVKDQYTLACWYFYVCIYMRGGIESLQAFNALIRMWRQSPHFFDPGHAALMRPEDIQPVLKKFIGWDSKAASINWVYNSRRLMQDWKGDPLNLTKGLRDYDEALRRMRNKMTQRDLREAGVDGAGFRGFQPKMVSMLLYFYDWEGQSLRGRNQRWLKPRFYYPSPADFHNFRLALATIAMTVERNPADDIWEEVYGGQLIRTSERISAPWRKTVMAYLLDRQADPLEIADAIWLFSLVMCGNSPATVTKGMRSEEKPNKKEEKQDLLSAVQVEWDHSE